MALSDQVQKAIATYIWGTQADPSAMATAVTAIQYFDGGLDELLVDRTPIIGVTQVFDVSASAAVTTTDWDFYTAMGSIYKNNGSNFGNDGERRRFKVTYTYGFTVIPDDVQLAIDTWVNYLTADDTGALKGYKTGDDSETYGDAVSLVGMPMTVKLLLSKYKRRLF